MLGLPKISIVFKSTATTAIQRGERGIVALILKDDAENGFKEMVTVTDIPAGLTEENKEYINLAFMGTVNPPKKVLIYVMATDDDYIAALNYLENVKFNYLAIPAIESGDTTAIASWIKSMRDTKDIKVKAVLPKTTADHEGIINFTNELIKTKDKTYTTAQYCARVAGCIAGLPLTVAPTYQVFPELIEIDHLTNSEVSTRIGQGEFVLFNDGEKVKVARGVNSLVTITKDKGVEFQKITIVDKLDLIHADVKTTTEDNYIGKVMNSYDNKVLLISAIQGYFKKLEIDNLLEKGQSTIGVDMTRQEAFLQGIGVDTSTMNEQIIKEYPTQDKVFIKAVIRPLDAMEVIDLNIGI